VDGFAVHASSQSLHRGGDR